jgi:uncharacterized protein YutE (UPF0331/DUF86 family)
MVDRAVMERRLRALRGFLEGMRRRFAGTTVEAFVADEDAQLIAERLLQLACEACIDMANHVISDRGGEQPESYRQAFAELVRMGLVPEELGAGLQRMTAMRNILVHCYLAVDPAQVHAAVTRRLVDLERFAACVAQLMT